MSDDELLCKTVCQDLMVNYAWALDRGANEEAADMFTDDGIIAQPGGERTGPEVRAFLRKRSPDIVTHHILTNVIVQPVDQIMADGRAYVMVYRAPAKPDTLPRLLPSAPHGVGQWLVRFRKTSKGWRICRFEAVPRLAPAD